jgi:hypothetical protein
MSCYNIEINKKLRENRVGEIKTEIWAEIEDKCKGTTMKKLIWWQDDEGIFHDGTLDLEVELREEVDNVWIEKSRKW